MNGGRDGVRADEPVPAAAVGRGVADEVSGFRGVAEAGGVGREAAAGAAGRSGGREAVWAPAAVLAAAARGRDGVAEAVSGGRDGVRADVPVPAASVGRGVADEVSGGRGVAEAGGVGREAAAGAAVLPAWGSGA